MAESAACEKKFISMGNVGVTITLPCWCYGNRNRDMDPMRRKPSGGFNGTGVWGSLPCAAAAHSQKGIPAFSIYGHDVRMPAIPPFLPTSKNCCVCARQKLAVTNAETASLRRRRVDGIAGSIVDHNCF